MRISLAVAVLLASSAGALALSSAGSAPDAPSSEPAETARALLLTVRINARGVSVLQAVRKPDVGYRPTRDAASLPFGWLLRDRDGNVVTHGGFDPSRLCLDATHEGSPPHVEGDFNVPHETHTNVKVPDLVFDRIEFLARDGGGMRAFGTATRRELGL